MGRDLSYKVISIECRELCEKLLAGEIKDEFGSCEYIGNHWDLEDDNYRLCQSRRNPYIPSEAAMDIFELFEYVEELTDKLRQILTRTEETEQEESEAEEKAEGKENNEQQKQKQKQKLQIDQHYYKIQNITEALSVFAQFIKMVGTANYMIVFNYS